MSNERGNALTYFSVFIGSAALVANIYTQVTLKGDLTLNREVITKEITWSNNRFIIRDNIYQIPNYYPNTIKESAVENQLAAASCLTTTKEGKDILEKLGVIDYLSGMFFRKEAKTIKRAIFILLSSNFLQKQLEEYSIRYEREKEKVGGFYFTDENIIPILGAVYAHCKELGIPD